MMGKHEEKKTSDGQWTKPIPPAEKKDGDNGGGKHGGGGKDGGGGKEK